MEISNKIRNFILENVLMGQDDSVLDNEDSFLEKGIIDSTGILELIQFIEETYDIRIDDEELVPENFDSLKNIVQYLERKLLKTAANS